MTNGPLSQNEANKAMANMPGMNHKSMQGMSMAKPPEGAEKVPLYPQDAFMEGDMMAMDREVSKPETLGLPPGWSGYVGGMMTLLRVMPPDRYDEVMKLKVRQNGKGNDAR